MVMGSLGSVLKKENEQGKAQDERMDIVTKAYRKGLIRLSPSGKGVMAMVILEKKVEWELVLNCV